MRSLLISLFIALVAPGALGQGGCPIRNFNSLVNCAATLGNFALLELEQASRTQDAVTLMTSICSFRSPPGTVDTVLACARTPLSGCDQSVETVRLLLSSSESQIRQTCLLMDSCRDSVTDQQTCYRRHVDALVFSGVSRAYSSGLLIGAALLLVFHKLVYM